MGRFHRIDDDFLLQIERYAREEPPLKIEVQAARLQVHRATVLRARKLLRGLKRLPESLPPPPRLALPPKGPARDHREAMRKADALHFEINRKAKLVARLRKPTEAELQAEIERFMAAKGVTVCRPAVAAPVNNGLGVYLAPPADLQASPAAPAAPPPPPGNDPVPVTLPPLPPAPISRQSQADARRARRAPPATRR